MKVVCSSTMRLVPCETDFHEYVRHCLHAETLACQFVCGKNQQTFKIYNPATEDEICQVHEALASDVDWAVDAAEGAFRAWRDLSANERAAPMARLVQLILRDADELAELDAVAMGKYG